MSDWSASLRACPATASGRESFPRSAGAPGSAETRTRSVSLNRARPASRVNARRTAASAWSNHTSSAICGVCQLIIDNRIRRQVRARCCRRGLWRESRRVPAWAGDSSAPLADVREGRTGRGVRLGMAPLSGYVTSLRFSECRRGCRTWQGHG